MTTHYDVLGLNTEASAEDIERAYHNAQQEHATLGQSLPEAVTNAYKILSDPAKRRQYDVQLIIQGTSSGAVETYLRTDETNAPKDWVDSAAFDESTPEWAEVDWDDSESASQEAGEPNPATSLGDLLAAAEKKPEQTDDDIEVPDYLPPVADVDDLYPRARRRAREAQQNRPSYRTRNPYQSPSYTTPKRSFLPLSAGTIILLVVAGIVILSAFWSFESASDPYEDRATYQATAVALLATSTPETLDYSTLADAAYDAEDYEEAVDLYTDAIVQDPNNRHLYERRALSYYWLYEYDDALADFSRAHIIDPDSDWAIGWRGWIYYLQGENELALRDIATSVRLDPENAITYVDRAIFAFDDGDVARANADFTKAIELYPPYLFTLESDTPAQSSTEWLVKNYSRVVDYSPTNPISRVYRGSLYAHLGDVDNAIADFQAAIENAPEFAPAYHALGDLYFQQGSEVEALAAYSKYMNLTLNEADANVVARAAELQYEQETADETPNEATNDQSGG